MTVSTSNLFTRQDGYLYSSAYHYWNNYSALSQLDKPLVFIDLDSCLPSELISVDITSLENTTYKVPILNTEKRLCIDFGFNSEETYQAISNAIALWILENNFPAIAQYQEAVSHLTQYLQKISFFRSIQPYVNQDYFEIIVEILHQDRVFYKKVILSPQAIANIITQIKIDINQLTLQKK